MSWRIVEIPDSDAGEYDLTDSELVGMDILLRENMGYPIGEINVYWRAWVKLENATKVAAFNQRGGW